MSSSADQFNKVYVAGSSDDFALVSAHFVEEIDGDFSLTVNAITGDPNAANDSLFGMPLSVEISYRHDAPGHPGFMRVPPDQVKERFVNGLIFEIRRGDEVSDPGLPFYDPNGGAQYFVQFVAKPQFEQTKFTTTSRAFANMGPVSTVARILNGYGIQNQTGDASDGNANAPHILQYQESNYSFCRRMLQKAGASYYFSHEDGKHIFHAFSNAPQNSAIEIGIEPFKDSLFRNFSWRKSATTKTHSVHDWDASTHSHKNLVESAADSLLAVPGSVENIYPSGLAIPGNTQYFAKARSVADLSDAIEVTAEIGAPSVCVGEIYEFSGSEDNFLNTKFIVSRVEFSLASDMGADFVGEVTLREHSVGIAPLPTIPHPRVPGLLSAVVVEPSEKDHANPQGEYLAKTGRIKVRYTFDNATQSFWARVSQAWAGNDYGTWFTPRVGHEVLIGFLDDDPDTPIVMGSLFNGKNKLAYQQELDDQVSYIKTKSNDGYNELFFRDKKDEELVRTKAHLDMVTEVGRHHSIHVKTDYSLTAGKDLHKKPAMSAGDPEDGSEGNMDFYAQKDIVMEAGENMKITVGKKMEVEVGDEVKITVGKSILTMKKDGTVNIDCKDATLKASGDVKVKASKGIAMESGQDTGIKSKGDVNVETKAKMNLKAASDTELDSKGNLTAKASLNAEIKAGAKLDVTAGAPLSIKGATVKIN